MMDLKLLFILLWTMVHTRDLAAFSISNEFCNSCINSNNGSYWCAYEAYSTGGYCCRDGQSKSDCIKLDSDPYECSNENRPQRAEYLLCPRETSQCQNTDEFYIARDEQISRVETGNVSHGRTCEYVITLYDPVTLSSNNSNTYDVTVDVEYVHSDTYLGVYKLALYSNSSELVQEVGAGFIGTINTTVDINTDVYVQLYPNSSMGSSIFNITTKKIPESNGNILFIIGVICIICGFLGLASFGAYGIFKRFSKSRSVPIDYSPFQPEPGTQGKMIKNHKGVHYINGKHEELKITKPQIPGEDEASTEIQGETHQDQEETANGEVTNKELDVSNDELHQQDPIEEV